MRTDVRSATSPTVNNEPQSYKSRKDSCLSPTACHPVKGTFQVTMPNMTEACGEEHKSYQLKIMETSSSIVPVSSAHISLEQAVILVLAIEKFKALVKQRHLPEDWKHDGASFTDSYLLGDFNAVMEDVDPYIIHDTAGSSACRFRFMQSVQQHFMDDRNRSLILSENLQLLAVSLQRPADAVQLDVRYYKSTGTNTELLPVVLGLNRENLFITCTGPRERPKLKIEKWEENLRNISSTTDLLRFMFYKRAGSAGLYFELESAMYRGWYISTSQKNGQPIEMDVKGSNKRVTIFTAD
ncbi:interleukin-1 beta [Stegostoma tigrinum]|uniref:interleukin-1 beta n=1 Tax=Stegostoma tigrinum TaxID=3053191 RepID=UPI00202B367A|nr:interleukin-1 beta [Stegostoma tigrinum]